MNKKKVKKLGSIFGILSIFFGILGLASPWLGLLFPFLIMNFLVMASIGFAILAIIFGVKGISKNDSKAPGIVGLIFEIPWILNFFLYAMFLAAPHI